MSEIDRWHSEIDLAISTGGEVRPSNLNNRTGIPAKGKTIGINLTHVLQSYERLRLAASFPVQRVKRRASRRLIGEGAGDGVGQTDHGHSKQQSGRNRRSKRVGRRGL